MNSIDEMLNMISDDFDVKSANKGEFEKLPDGEYEGVVKDFKGEMTEKGIRYTFVFELESGKKQFYSVHLIPNKMFNFNIKSLMQAIYHISNNNKLDYSNLRYDELNDCDNFVADISKEILNKNVTFKLETKKDYQNVTVLENANNEEFPF